MSAWWIVPAFLAGLALGVGLVARLVKAYTDEIQARLADLFDEVRYREREGES